MANNKVKTAKTEKSSQGRAHWLPLVAVAFGVSLIIMDATIVNVALPVMIKDIGLTITQAEWINAVYSLMFASLLITFGRLGDLYGRRTLFALGMGLFVIASLLAGFASDGTLLITARVAQGMGAAMILPTTLSTLNTLYRGKERAIAFAVWGATIGGMAALGPLLGSWLTTEFSWHWAFWLNIPAGLFVLYLTLKYIPNSRDETTPRGLDYPAIALSTIGLGAIVFALIEGQRYGWIRQDSGDISPIPFIFTTGVILMAVFTRYQLVRARQKKPVLVDLRILDIKSFRYGSLAALIVAFGEFGLLFTLPLLLQNALGYTALQTGFTVAALALGTFIISGSTPQLTRKYGARAVVRTGLSLEVLAIAAIALTLSDSISGWVVTGWLFVYGIGVGMATAQLTNVIMTDVPADESGQASGLQSTFRQLGSTLGIAILGAALISTFNASTIKNFQAIDESFTSSQQQTIDSTVDSIGAPIQALRDNLSTKAIGDAAQQGLIEASKVTTGIAAGIVGLGLLCTWLLPRHTKDI